MATRPEARKKTTTPWGAATVVEEAKLAQRAGAKRFATVFELLESDGGDLLVRIAYTTGDTVRRGPVTLRARDVDRLHAALGARPGLVAALGLRRRVA